MWNKIVPHSHYRKDKHSLYWFSRKDAALCLCWQFFKFYHPPVNTFFNCNPKHRKSKIIFCKYNSKLRPWVGAFSCASWKSECFYAAASNPFQSLPGTDFATKTCGGHWITIQDRSPLVTVPSYPCRSEYMMHLNTCCIHILPPFSPIFLPLVNNPYPVQWERGVSSKWPSAQIWNFLAATALGEEQVLWG